MLCWGLLQLLCHIRYVWGCCSYCATDSLLLLAFLTWVQDAVACGFMFAHRAVRQPRVGQDTLLSVLHLCNTCVTLVHAKLEAEQAPQAFLPAAPGTYWLAVQRCCLRCMCALTRSTYWHNRRCSSRGVLCVCVCASTHKQSRLCPVCQQAASVVQNTLVLLCGICTQGSVYSAQQPSTSCPLPVVLACA